jgi:hypothetical protein
LRRMDVKLMARATSHTPPATVKTKRLVIQDQPITRRARLTHHQQDSAPLSTPRATPPPVNFHRRPSTILSRRSAFAVSLAVVTPWSWPGCWLCAACVHARTSFARDARLPLFSPLTY